MMLLVRLRKQCNHPAQGITQRGRHRAPAGHPALREHCPVDPRGLVLHPKHTQPVLFEGATASEGGEMSVSPPAEEFLHLIVLAPSRLVRHRPRLLLFLRSATAAFCCRFCCWFCPSRLAGRQSSGRRPPTGQHERVDRHGLEQLLEDEVVVGVQISVCLHDAQQLGGQLGAAHTEAHAKLLQPQCTHTNTTHTPRTHTHYTLHTHNRARAHTSRPGVARTLQRPRRRRTAAQPSA